MEAGHKKILTHLHSDLLDSLGVSGDLLAKLISKEIINKEDRRCIWTTESGSERDMEGKAMKLLEMLPRCGATAFVEFSAVLAESTLRRNQELSQKLSKHNDALAAAHLSTRKLRVAQAIRASPPTSLPTPHGGASVTSNYPPGPLLSPVYSGRRPLAREPASAPVAGTRRNAFRLESGHRATSCNNISTSAPPASQGEHWSKGQERRIVQLMKCMPVAQRGRLLNFAERLIRDECRATACAFHVADGELSAESSYYPSCQNCCPHFSPGRSRRSTLPFAAPLCGQSGTQTPPEICVEQSRQDLSPGLPDEGITEQQIKSESRTRRFTLPFAGPSCGQSGTQTPAAKCVDEFREDLSSGLPDKGIIEQQIKSEIDHHERLQKELQHAEILAQSIEHCQDSDVIITAMTMGYEGEKGMQDETLASVLAEATCVLSIDEEFQSNANDHDAAAMVVNYLYERDVIDGTTTVKRFASTASPVTMAISNQPSPNTIAGPGTCTVLVRMTLKSNMSDHYYRVAQKAFVRCLQVFLDDPSVRVRSATRGCAVLLAEMRAATLRSLYEMAARQPALLFGIGIVEMVALGRSTAVQLEAVDPRTLTMMCRTQGREVARLVGHFPDLSKEDRDAILEQATCGHALAVCAELTLSGAVDCSQLLAVSQSQTADTHPGVTVRTTTVRPAVACRARGQTLRLRRPRRNAMHNSMVSRIPRLPQTQSTPPACRQNSANQQARASSASPMLARRKDLSPRR